MAKIKKILLHGSIRNTLKVIFSLMYKQKSMLLKEASAPFSDQTRAPIASRPADAKHDSQMPTVPAVSPRPATPLGTGLLYFEAPYRLSDNSVSTAGNPQCLFLLILMAAQLLSKLRPNHPFLCGPFCHKYAPYFESR